MCGVVEKSAAGMSVSWFWVAALVFISKAVTMHVGKHSHLQSSELGAVMEQAGGK